MAKCNLDKEHMPIGTVVKLVGKNFPPSVRGEIVTVDAHYHDWRNERRLPTVHGNYPGGRVNGQRYWFYVTRSSDYEVRIVRNNAE